MTLQVLGPEARDPSAGSEIPKRDFSGEPPASRARAGYVSGLLALGVVALKAIKGAKLAKLALFGAALWSIALVRPLPFAVALMYAILVHETGHILAMRYRGLKTSGIWFIPFLGAVAVARQPFRSHGETYFVAIAGPVFGLLSIVPLIAAPLLLSCTGADAAAWLAYASTAAFINLFNLLPIGALDGGRIVKSMAMSLSPVLGFAVVGGGLLLGAGLLALGESWVLAVILLLSIVDLRKSRGGQVLPPMSRKAVAGGMALYILLFTLFSALGVIGATAAKHLLAKEAAAVAEADRVPGNLADLGCTREGDLRSVASDQPTEITFTSHSTLTLGIYWLNGRGKRAFYAKLLPGKSVVQRSYASHPWLIAASPSGHCLGIFRAASSPGTVVIRSTAE